MITFNQNIFQVSLVVLFVTIYFLSETQSVEYYKEKPKFLENAACKLYQPHFSKCAKVTMQQLIDELTIGIPEFVEEHGPFDPMKVRDISFKQDNNEVVTMRVNMTEIVVTGFSKTKIVSCKASKKDLSWVTKTVLPKMHLDAQYQMEGRILLIPLKGVGKMFLEMENLESVLHTKVRLYDRGGFTFYNVTSIRADINLTRLRTHFGNLFNGGSKELEESTNEFFNENWQDFYEAIKPIILETVENINYVIMHKIFNLIPANFFVEDTPTAAEFYANETTPK